MNVSGLRRIAVHLAVLMSVLLGSAVTIRLSSPSLSAYALPTPTASPMTIDQRVEKLEVEVQALKATEKKKDVWDKLAASGPLVGGVLVAIIGALATILYNSRQQRAAERQTAQQLTVNRVQTLGELMPFLSSEDHRQVEAALVSIAELGDPDLATSMAVIYKGEGGVGALKRLAGGADPAIAQTARATLDSVFANVSQSVAIVYVGGVPHGVAVFVGKQHMVTPNFVTSSQTESSQPAITVEVGEAKGGVLGLGSKSDNPDDLTVLKSEIVGIPLPLGNASELALGDKVTIVGLVSRHLEARPKIRIASAVVEGQLDDGSIQLGDVQINQGMGGGAVLDSSNALVGIITKSNDTQSRSGGLAIPSETIVRAISHLSLQ